MSISAQIVEMNQKTIEIVAENEELRDKVQILRRENSLLGSSELEYARRSQINQKATCLIAQKLSEYTKLE